MRQEPLLQRGAFVDEPREKTRSTRRWRCKARACYAQQLISVRAIAKREGPKGKARRYTNAHNELRNSNVLIE